MKTLTDFALAHPIFFCFLVMVEGFCWMFLYVIALLGVVHFFGEETLLALTLLGLAGIVFLWAREFRNPTS